MNTRKTVYEKLFAEKTELSTHEIELGLIDEVKKLQVVANNSHDKAINELKKWLPWQFINKILPSLKTTWRLYDYLLKNYVLN